MPPVPCMLRLTKDSQSSLSNAYIVIIQFGFSYLNIQDETSLISIFPMKASKLKFYPDLYMLRGSAICYNSQKIGGDCPYNFKLRNQLNLFILSHEKRY